MGTSVKTGSAPDFKAATDLRNVIPAVGASVGIGDIGEAIAFYKKHRTAIQAVLAFLGGIFGRGKKDTATGAGAPPPPEPSPLPVPEPTPVPPTPLPVPPASKRIPTELHSEMTLIETKRRPRESGGGRDSHGNTIGNRQEFAEIKAGTSPTRRGARVHIDTTPSDQFGKFRPGGEENKNLLNDPADDPNWTPNHRIEHVITGGGELTSEYDDYGCTPVVLVPWEQEPGVPFPIDTGKRWEMTYQAIYHAPDGGVVKGNIVRWLVEE